MKMKEAFIVDGSDKVEEIPLNNKKGGNVETQTRIRKKKGRNKKLGKRNKQNFKISWKEKKIFKIKEEQQNNIY